MKTNLSLRELDQPRDRQWRLVDLAHEKPLQNHRVEVASGSPYQKPVQLIVHHKNHSTNCEIHIYIYIYAKRDYGDLDKELEVDIIGFRGSSLAFFDFTAGDQIDALVNKISRALHVMDCREQ